ncbi:hypothetical protein B0T24DRAFT_381421 [Lasiosphaeria ovina]|uniref:Secreted protein n=1 Tax=Lasiosphaeria ovina TaxID=92902 RepID=A0AAE0JZX5_9PEZI|nr:hypothetical protein B0T24DRAFT_381421 [Lasiosphaeria ovina]
MLRHTRALLCILHLVTGSPVLPFPQIALAGTPPLRPFSAASALRPELQPSYRGHRQGAARNSQDLPRHDRICCNISRSAPAVGLPLLIAASHSVPRATHSTASQQHRTASRWELNSQRETLPERFPAEPIGFQRLRLSPVNW